MKVRSRLLLGVLLALVPASLLPAAAVPVPLLLANDDFADATEIAALPFRDEVDDRLATREDGEPDCSGAETVSVWYRFAPATETDIWAHAQTGKVYVADGSFTHSVGIFEGTTLAGLTKIRCHEGQYLPQVRFTAEAGKTYYIRLGGYIGGPVTFDLETSPAVAGTVTSLGEPATGACVYAHLGDSQAWSGIAKVRPDGSYSLPLAAGSYKLFFGCSRYVPEWYDGAPSQASGILVSVPSSGRVTAIDADLSRKPSISGTVTAEGLPLVTCVTAFDEGGTAYQGGVSSAEDGTYVLPLAAPSTVKLRFGCSFQLLLQEWYDDAPDAASATAISVPAVIDFPGVDADLTWIRAPANDAFANAAAVQPSVRRVVNTRNATTETGEPVGCAGYTATATAWYAYDPPAGTRDLPVLATLEGPAYRRLIVSVYTGTSLTDLRLFRCAQGIESYKQRTALGFPASAGTRYFIQVGSESSGELLTFGLLSAAPSAFTDATFGAPLPCGPACPYWLEPVSSANSYRAACNPEPFTADETYTDLTITVPDTLPGGSVPAGLIFKLNPAGDSDAFICGTVPDAAESYFVAVGANSVSDPCDLRVAGCPEAAGARVKPGETYVLRVYNWSDWEAAPGAYAFVPAPAAT